MGARGAQAAPALALAGRPEEQRATAPTLKRRAGAGAAPTLKRRAGAGAAGFQAVYVAASVCSQARFSRTPRDR